MLVFVLLSRRNITSSSLITLILCQLPTSMNLNALMHCPVSIFHWATSYSNILLHIQTFTHIRHWKLPVTCRSRALLTGTLKESLDRGTLGREGFPYLQHEPPLSPPGPAQSPDSSSSSSHVWTGSMAKCLRAAPQVLMDTGTTTPLNARSGRTARWRRSARLEYHHLTTPSHFRPAGRRGTRKRKRRK